MKSEFGSALTARYRKSIWRPFMSAVKEYRLVSAGDRICVCVSGGKDSMLLAKCMQELQRHSPLEFSLRFLCLNPGYAPENLERIQSNARLLEIPLEFCDADIFGALDVMDCNPCFMCAKMRRGHLYRQAQRMGCNKIALGHHFDDAVETMLMSMIYAGQLRGMRPRLKSENVSGMELIRPLYKVRESAILQWRDENALAFVACACQVTRDARLRTDGSSDSKRQEMKALIARLNALNPDAAANIFRSAHNAKLGALNGWKQDGETHSFLEEFED